MIGSLLPLVKQCIPPVSAKTIKELNEEISDKKFDQGIFTNKPDSSTIYQGDIVSDIEFILFNEEGIPVRSKAPGMLISHSCDLDNKVKPVIFALCIPEKLFQEGNKGSYRDARDQKLTHYLFVPSEHVIGDNIFVNFNIVTTYSSKYILDKFRDTTSHQLTLLEFGYHIFLAKLTVHLFRNTKFAIS